MRNQTKMKILKLSNYYVGRVSLGKTPAEVALIPYLPCFPFLP